MSRNELTNPLPHRHERQLLRSLLPCFKSLTDGGQQFARFYGTAMHRRDGQQRLSNEGYRSRILVQIALRVSPIWLAPSDRQAVSSIQYTGVPFLRRKPLRFRKVLSIACIESVCNVSI